MQENFKEYIAIEVYGWKLVVIQTFWNVTIASKQRSSQVIEAEQVVELDSFALPQQLVDSLLEIKHESYLRKPVDQFRFKYWKKNVHILFPKTNIP